MMIYVQIAAGFIRLLACWHLSSTTQVARGNAYFPEIQIHLMQKLFQDGPQIPQLGGHFMGENDEKTLHIFLGMLQIAIIFQT